MTSEPGRITDLLYDLLQALSVCMCEHDSRNIGGLHALGVSVEIELKMDWQGCKQV